ncbi:MAG: PD-(D/E)XK nuclease family protein [Acidimicrobiales bacterium]|nr:PD-(D/E)XK nuclease family protein [Acidimicrobiales bacterium]
MTNAKIIRTNYGRAATVALAEAVATFKDGDPLAPVTIVVTDHAQGIRLRRLLARQSIIESTLAGITAIKVGTLLDLSRDLTTGTVELEGRRPVTDAVVLASVRRILAGDPGVFGPVSDHPSLERALVAAHRELREVNAEGVDRLTRLGGLSAGLALVHQTLVNQLAPDFHDERERSDLATQRIHAGSVSLPPLVVHLPGGLTASESRLLTAIGEAGPTTIISGHVTGHPDPEAEKLAAMLGLSVPESPATLPPVDKLVISVPDQEEEARVAVRQILAAARTGTPLAQIAVVHPPSSDYVRLLHERLRASGIEFNGSSVRRLDETTVGRFLIGALALSSNELRRIDLEALFATAPLWDPNNHRVPESAWTRLARRSGVVGGLDDWTMRLKRLATEFSTQRTEEESADARTWLMDRLVRDADLCRQLLTFVSCIDQDLRRISDARSWAARCGYTARLLGRYLGSDSVREDWPVDELLAVEAARSLLDRLALLDEVEPAATFSGFCRAVVAECQRPLGREGRTGQGVQVVGIDQSPGLDVEVVILLGLSEGVMPTRPAHNALLPDITRLTAQTGLPVRRDHTTRQHRSFIAAISAASQQVVLVQPRGDLRRSGTRPPSRWLLAEIEAFTGWRPNPGQLAQTTAPWYQHVASFAHALTVDEPATDQEYELGLLLDGRVTEATLSQTDPAFRRGIECIQARLSTNLTRFDGNLVGVTIPKLDADEISATRLERWVECPFAYFSEYVLGIQGKEEPVADLHLSALVRGSIIHRCLERLVVEGLEQGTLPKPGEPWSADDHRHLSELLLQECARAEARGEAAHPLYWPVIRSRLDADLQTFLVTDSVIRASQNSTPVAAEYQFGGSTALPVVLADGRVLRFRGAIDRVDRVDNGQVNVIDVKSGKPDHYRAIRDDSPFPAGTRLQLPIYGLAAANLGHGPTGEAAFAFIGTERSADHRIGYHLTPEVLNEFATVLERIVAGIDAGAFPNHPPTPTRVGGFTCPHCSPDGLDTRRLHAACVRKASDPAVALHLQHLAAHTSDESEESP